MLIENIKLIDYKKENEKLIVIVDSNIDHIKKELNNKDELSIYTDNLETRYLVETLFGYSRIIAIKENMLNSTYEVEIVKEGEIQLELLRTKEKINLLENENADLLLDAAIKDSKIEMLENDMADLMFEIAMINGGMKYELV